jgi:hypothetical protein
MVGERLRVLLDENKGPWMVHNISTQFREIVKAAGLGKDVHPARVAPHICFAGSQRRSSGDNGLGEPRSFQHGHDDEC